MKIAVFGATGNTGSQVVDAALARGFEVTALVREPARVTQRHARLTVLAGDPTVAADVAGCVRGADAVVHCLGVGGKGNGKPTTLISDSVKAALVAMDEAQVPRIVCMSNLGAGGSGPWWFNRVLVPVFARWLRPLIDDKDRMEAALRASRVEWVSVRLVGITQGPARSVRTSADGLGLRPTITDASVAAFLLDRVHGDAFLRQTPSISN
jgi:uncharacterized protein YbjT (DUF2867 family)